METTQKEQLAFGLLQSNPGILHQLADATGQITMDAVITFYTDLSKSLIRSKQKRSGIIEDAEIVVDKKE